MLSARIQMRRKDFQHDAVAIASLTLADLKQAEKEESSHMMISNPQVKVLCKHVFAASGRVKGSDKMRASYRGQVWETCLKLRGPSLWLTINPSDLHDPIVQLFAGKEIDMDDFNAKLGPDSSRRAANVAHNPYAALKYFFFVINTVLSTLFGITVSKDHVSTEPGILGHVLGYFGVVEAQGHSTLHVHMLLWLEDAPNAEEMHTLLETEQFRQWIRNFIRHNIKAHVDGLDDEMIKLMPREAQLAYSHPPNPDDDKWIENFLDKLRQVVRSQQIHTCTRMTCLHFNKHGRLTCKCRVLQLALKGLGEASKSLR